MSDINKNLKKMIDELDLDRRVNEFAVQAETVLKKAAATAADFASEHRDDVDRTLDKLTNGIDERTNGKYAAHVGKVRDTVQTGLSKFTERRSGTDPDGPSDA